MEGKKKSHYFKYSEILELDDFFFYLHIRGFSTTIIPE